MIKIDNELYEIKLGVSSRQADLAIVSSDSSGTPGYLNKLALSVYGYDKDILKTINLDSGYNVIQGKGLRPILVIVTIDKTLGVPNTALTFRRNLDNGIKGNLELLANKKIWFPLLGTGTGGLNFDESLEITINTINGSLNELKKRNVKFIISVPNNDRGKEFFNEINDIPDTPQPKKETKKKKSIPIDLESKTIDNDISSKVSSSSDSVSNITDLLKGLSGKFYIISSALGEKIDINGFLHGLSEKNPNHKKFIDLINNVKSGDILIAPEILKSQKGGRLYSVNQLGFVYRNKESADGLKINWKLKDQKMEFMTSINYSNRLISEATNVELNEILSQINPEELQLLFREANTKTSITTITKITSIPGITSDVDSGTDLLEISRDVAAFARVIAAKDFTPPLAIALFGKWGSGKSFFIRKLKERIIHLSDTKSKLGFCKGIAHIHFNAWSYMDTNLWASIITKIFNGLNNYINNTSTEQEYKNKIKKELTNKLNITQSELSRLEQQKSSIDSKLKGFKERKTELENELNEKINEIKNTSITDILKKIDEKFNVQKKIEESIENNITIIDSKNQFGKIVPQEYWKTPEELYKETKTVLTFLKVFFRAGKWKVNLLIGIILLLGIVFIPIGLNYISSTLKWTDLSFPSNIWYILTILGTIYVRGVKTFKQIQPLALSFWKIKEEYQSNKEEAFFNYKQKEALIQIEADKIKNEIISLDHKINLTNQQKEQIEFKFNNTLSTEALNSFIERKSSSKKYKKHLGLISLIRKDFEILSNLFTDHKVEIQNLEEGKEYDKFKKDFKPSLERIVLYIDDLDRCSEDRVVEVLEAVNLLMAYPLFVVVVGVDPRWVKNALIKKHQLHFVDSKIADKELIEPSSYLEKIFQVPFNLKAATDDSVKKMIKALVDIQPEPSDDAKKLPDTYKPNQNTDTNIPPNTDSTTTKTEERIEDDNKPPKDQNLKTQEPVPEEEEIIETQETIASIQFSEKEIELLQEMSVIIGSSPRAIKRFINIYRIVKAHENFGYTNEEDIGEMLSVMFLLALPIGKFKNLTIIIYNQIQDNSRDSWKLLKLMNENINQGIQKLELTSIRDSLLNSGAKPVLDQKVELFNKHLPFIKRFAYDI